ncbi:hypothetical protein DERP_013407 [Dermatophagoides pteronyssinus]|nr:hypothetical protein DERP_013407 [Dermatophagoides pteronyssinus]
MFGICMVEGHVLPYANSIPKHLQDLYEQVSNKANQPPMVGAGVESRRNGRGLFSTLSGLGNVAAAAAAGSSLLAGKDPDDDDNIVNHLSSSSSSSSNGKGKPYAFNDVEMSALQTMISIRNIIGDLFHKVGFNLPSSLASLITRSSDPNGLDDDKHSLLSSDSSAANILSTAASKVNAGLLIRGLALSLPLLIPMANQIRRMSSDGAPLPLQPFASSSSSSSVPTSSLMAAPITFQLPQFDPYGYDRALHRRRGKRSATALSESTQRMLRRQEQQRILRYLKQMEEMYGIQQYGPQQQQQQTNEPYYLRNVFISQPQSQPQQPQQPHSHDQHNHHYQQNLFGRTRTTLFET